jgi:hypothetical protein
MLRVFLILSVAAVSVVEERLKRMEATEARLLQRLKNLEDKEKEMEARIEQRLKALEVAEEGAARKKKKSKKKYKIVAQVVSEGTSRSDREGEERLADKKEAPPTSTNTKTHASLSTSPVQKIQSGGNSGSDHQGEEDLEKKKKASSDVTDGNNAHTKVAVSPDKVIKKAKKKAKNKKKAKKDGGLLPGEETISTVAYPTIGKKDPPKKKEESTESTHSESTTIHELGDVRPRLYPSLSKLPDCPSDETFLLKNSKPAAVDIRQPVRRLPSDLDYIRDFESVVPQEVSPAASASLPEPYTGYDLPSDLDYKDQGRDFDSVVPQAVSSLTAASASLPEPYIGYDLPSDLDYKDQGRDLCDIQQQYQSNVGVVPNTEAASEAHRPPVESSNISIRIGSGIAPPRLLPLPQRTAPVHEASLPPTTDVNGFVPGLALTPMTGYPSTEPPTEELNGARNFRVFGRRREGNRPGWSGLAAA